jgi:hypothetical protein
MIKTVFIFGPFREDPEGNKLKFEEAARKLWHAGFYAFNPIANCFYMKGEFSEDEFARRGVEALKKLDFDAAFRLVGWENSSGARKEFVTICEKDIPIFDSVEEICKWMDIVEKYEVRL